MKFAELARAGLLVGVCGFTMTVPAVAFAQAQALPEQGMPEQAVAPAADGEEALPAPEEEAKPATDRGEDTTQGNEIVVTATKREQTLQDVPVAVTVTSAQTLERAQIRDLKDLASVVPSLRVNQQQSSANTNFIIRGFGNGANNAGIEPSVGVFVDGVYRSRSAAQIGDFPDVQRIEVLRGPQSTLFGKNASAGVVSVVTQAPQFKFGGNLEATYGNYDAVVLKGVVTGPVADNVAVSLAGGYNKRDGYIHDLGTGHTVNDRNRWFVRGQTLWEASPALRVRIIGDYSRINENCCAAINLQPSAATTAIRALGGKVNNAADRYADVTYSNFDSTNDIRNWGLSAQADYDLGPLTFTSITAYRRTDALTNQDSDFTSADLLGENSQDLRIKTFTQEFRIATNIEGPLNFMLGGFYFNEKIDQSNRVAYGSQYRPYADLLIRSGTGGALNASSLEATVSGLTGQNYTGRFFGAGQGLDERYRLKNEAFSIFAQADFKVHDRLTITGGINFTRDTKNFSAQVSSSDVFSGLSLADIGQTGLTQQYLATAVGTALGLGAAANAAQIQGFATAQPGIFGALRTQATAFGAANANITPAQAAASGNPGLVGNPLLALKSLQFLPPFLGVPNGVEPGRTSDSKFTYTARIAYDLTRQINFYASFATGFKASSINLSRDSRPAASDAVALAAAGLTQVNQTYGSRFAGPESSTVLELGLKANWGLVTMNVAAFRQSIKGFQSNIFTGTGFYLSNAGKETVQGFEFEGTARPARGVQLSMAVTYLDPKYDSFGLSAVGDLSGTRPAGIPSISATWGAQIDHAFPNDDHLILRGDFHYEAQVRIQEGLPGFLSGGTDAAIAAARPFTREVSELNGSLTWAMHNGIEFSVWGRNILNHRWLLNIFDSVAQPGSISGYVNQPRTWGGTVRYRF